MANINRDTCKSISVVLYCLQRHCRRTVASWFSDYSVSLESVGRSNLFYQKRNYFLKSRILRTIEMMAQIAEMNTNSSALILYFFALIATDFAIINRKILDIEYRNRAPADWQGLIFFAENALRKPRPLRRFSRVWHPGDAGEKG